MACCKVPVKISGFSGGCATVGAGTVVSYLSLITTVSSVSGLDITNLGYLGLKCVNIACPPTLVVADTLGDLAIFLDTYLGSAAAYRDSNTTDMINGTTGTTATRAGIASLIAGCGCCSS